MPNKTIHRLPTTNNDDTAVNRGYSTEITACDTALSLTTHNGV